MTRSGLPNREKAPRRASRVSLFFAILSSTHLGHSTPEITREIYLYAIPEEQRRVVESVERLLFGPKWTQVQPPTQAELTRLN